MVKRKRVTSDAADADGRADSAVAAHAPEVAPREPPARLEQAEDEDDELSSDDEYPDWGLEQERAYLEMRCGPPPMQLQKTLADASAPPEGAVAVEIMQGIHRSWAAFRAYMRDYEQRTHSMLSTRCAISVALKNNELLWGGRPPSERIPVHLHTFQRVYACGRRRRRRAKGANERKTPPCPFTFTTELVQLRMGWVVMVKYGRFYHNHHLEDLDSRRAKLTQLKSITEQIYHIVAHFGPQELTHELQILTTYLDHLRLKEPPPGTSDEGGDNQAIEEAVQQPTKATAARIRAKPTQEANGKKKDGKKGEAGGNGGEDNPVRLQKSAKKKKDPKAQRKGANETQPHDASTKQPGGSETDETAADTRSARAAKLSSPRDNRPAKKTTKVDGTEEQTKDPTDSTEDESSKAGLTVRMRSWSIEQRTRVTPEVVESVPNATEITEAAVTRSKKGTRSSSTTEEGEVKEEPSAATRSSPRTKHRPVEDETTATIVQQDPEERVTRASKAGAAAWNGEAGPEKATRSAKAASSTRRKTRSVEKSVGKGGKPENSASQWPTTGQAEAVGSKAGKTARTDSPAPSAQPAATKQLTLASAWKASAAPAPSGQVAATQTEPDAELSQEVAKSAPRAAAEATSEASKYADARPRSSAGLTSAAPTIDASNPSATAAMAKPKSLGAKSPKQPAQMLSLPVWPPPVFAPMGFAPVRDGEDGDHDHVDWDVVLVPRAEAVRLLVSKHASASVAKTKKRR